MNKFTNAYKTIGEVVKILDLKTKKGKSSPTHTIRFWEKEFKQIRPKLFYGKRRYYDEKAIIILQKIKNLLKDEGMTIKGVKKYLGNVNSFNLDETKLTSIKVSKSNIKNKVEKISNLIKQIKKLG